MSGGTVSAGVSTNTGGNLFMGYNAVTSAFSKYAMQVLNVAETAAANCVLVATVVPMLLKISVKQMKN